MSYQKFLQQTIGVILVMLLLVGCSAPAATPVSEAPAATSTPEQAVTPTPEPPTSTPEPPPETPTPESSPPTPTISLPTAGTVVQNDMLQMTVTRVNKRTLISANQGTIRLDAPGYIGIVIEAKFIFTSTPIVLKTKSALLTDGSGKQYPAEGGGIVNRSGDYSRFCAQCESEFTVPASMSSVTVGFLFSVPEPVQELTFHYDTLPGISISDALNAPSPVVTWVKNHIGETVKVVGSYPHATGEVTGDLITFTLETTIRDSSVPIEGSDEIGIAGIAGVAPTTSLRWGDKASLDSFSSYFYALEGKNFAQDNRFLVEGEVTGEVYTGLYDGEYVILKVTSITLLKDDKPSQTWTVE